MTWAAAVAAATVVLIAVWGWRHAGDAVAYFAADRQAGPILVGLGGTAAGLSAFVFVGGPGLFSTIGAASLWIILSAPVTGALQCWAVGEPVVRLAARHGCLTIPDVIAARYGEGAPRVLAAGVVAIGGVATLAVQLKGAAVVGGVLLGVPSWTVALATAVATATYTAAGGMRAGLLAEAVQGAVMAAAAVGLAVAALGQAGGPTAAVATLAERAPKLLDAWGPGGPLVGLGWFALFALGTTAQPHYLQKFLFLRGHRSLRWLPLVLTGALLSVLTVWLGLGLGGTALALRGEISPSTADALTPAFLSGRAAPWLLTTALVAVVAAVMSTAAALLNLVAAAVVRDLPLGLGRKPTPGLGTARVATLAAAGLALVLTLLSGRTVALLGVLGWGTFTAGLLPVILLGLNWEGARRRGAVAAIAGGIAVQLVLEALRAGHGLSPSWEPGLTGAAVGVLLLVGLSATRGRAG